MKQLGKAVCYYLLFLGMQVIASTAVSTIYGFWLGFNVALKGEMVDQQVLTDKITSYLNENLMVIAIISSIVTILFLIVFFRIRKKKWLKEVNWNSLSKAYIPYVIVLGVALMILINFGVELLPESFVENYNQFSGMLMGEITVVSLLYSVILAPIVEEIIFRGLILSRLQKAMPVPVAILISSALFALAHGQILWIAYTFILGCVFAIVDVKTDTIVASVIIHMIFNLLGTTTSIWAPEPSVFLSVLLAGLGMIGTVFALVLLMKRQQVKTKDIVNED